MSRLAWHQLLWWLLTFICYKPLTRSNEGRQPPDRQGGGKCAGTAKNWERKRLPSGFSVIRYNSRPSFFLLLSWGGGTFPVLKFTSCSCRELLGWLVALRLCEKKIKSWRGCRRRKPCLLCAANTTLLKQREYKYNLFEKNIFIIVSLCVGYLDLIPLCVFCICFYSSSVLFFQIKSGASLQDAKTFQ